MTSAREVIIDTLGPSLALQAKCLGWKDTGDVADSILAALKEAGYVVVPREPTEKMCDAVRSTNVNIGSDDAPEIYQAMLTTAKD